MPPSWMTLYDAAALVITDVAATRRRLSSCASLVPTAASAPMPPLALTDEVLAEVFSAARLVPVECRGAFLERVADELAGQELGPGLVHRVAFKIARALVWDAPAPAVGE